MSEYQPYGSVRDRVTRWVRRRRQPFTLTVMANELGVSRQAAARWLTTKVARKAPHLGRGVWAPRTGAGK